MDSSGKVLQSLTNESWLASQNQKLWKICGILNGAMSGDSQDRYVIEKLVWCYIKQKLNKD